MLYSTCSLNPIEDEAVVNTLLKTLGSNVVLEDLPAIINQKYPCATAQVYLTGKLSRTLISPALPHSSSTCNRFPTWKQALQCEVPNIDLQKCVRIFPQDQNTGGFSLLY